MRRDRSVALGLGLLVILSGCVATTVGGGLSATVGTYSYFARTLEVVYGMSLHNVWPKALAAVESLNLQIDRQQIDGLGGNIEARRADSTRIQVALKPSGDHSTSISVRVGEWGDREQSERIQRTIRQQLGL